METIKASNIRLIKALKTIHGGKKDFSINPDRAQTEILQ